MANDPSRPLIDEQTLKPYLLRAFHDWIVNYQCTPFVVLSVEHDQVQAPKEMASDGKITLNISENAVRELALERDAISFHASFSGMEYYIYAPVDAVLALYSAETGQGVFFMEKEEGGFVGIDPANSTRTASQDPD